MIRKLLDSKEYVDFLVGRNGVFDQLVSSTIRKVKKDYRDDNCCHTLVFPYDTAQYRNNYDSFNKYYDQIDIYKKSLNAHFKTAFQIGNREMVDRSDLIVFYLERECGGAYQTYQYTIKQKKHIIKLPLSTKI